MNTRPRVLDARFRTRRWTAAVALSLAASLAATACGSDDKSSDATTADESASSTPADVETSAETDAFCQSTDALVSQISTLAAAGTDLSSLASAVNGINTTGAQLASAKPADAAAVAVCMQAVSAALTAAANGTSTATTVADGPATTVAGGTDSSNPEVQAFCTSADELATQLQQVMADPTSGDVADLTTKAQELATQATTLMTANPADVAAVTACLQRLTAALTPGAPGGPGATPTTVAGAPDGAPSAAVEEFCANAEALGQQLKDAIANPASADVAAITAQATELSTQAQQLITANPADAARISECVTKLNPTG